MSIVISALTSGWSAASALTANKTWLFVSAPGTGGSIQIQWSTDQSNWIPFSTSAGLRGAVPAAALYIRAFAKVATGTLTLTLATSPVGSLTQDQTDGINAGNLIASDGSVYALSEVSAYVTKTVSGVAFSGACEYAGYVCTVAAGNITIYDNTAASGTVIVPTTALAVGSFPAFGAGTNNKFALATGCYVVLSGAATVNVMVQ